MKNNATLDVLRPLFIALGSMAVAFGYADQAQITAIVGGVTTLVATGAELYVRFKERKRNNLMLQDLEDLGVYDGRKDGVIGAVARSAVTKLAERANDQ